MESLTHPSRHWQHSNLEKTFLLDTRHNIGGDHSNSLFTHGSNHFKLAIVARFSAILSQRPGMLMFTSFSSPAVSTGSGPEMKTCKKKHVSTMSSLHTALISNHGC